MSEVLTMEQGTPFEMEIAQRCIAVLVTHYPAHDWHVTVDAKNKILNVLNLSLSGRWGFTCHLSEVLNDPSMRTIVSAGGEILERFQIKRGALEQEALAELPADAAGDPIPVKD